MFRAALTVHDIDADSAIGTIIITDDRSSCRFSDDEEVSEYMYIIMLQLCACRKYLCCEIFSDSHMLYVHMRVCGTCS